MSVKRSVTASRRPGWPLSWGEPPETLRRRLRTGTHDGGGFSGDQTTASATPSTTITPSTITAAIPSRARSALSRAVTGPRPTASPSRTTPASTSSGRAWLCVCLVPLVVLVAPFPQLIRKRLVVWLVGHHQGYQQPERSETHPAAAAEPAASRGCRAAASFHVSPAGAAPLSLGTENPASSS